MANIKRELVETLKTVDYTRYMTKILSMYLSRKITYKKYKIYYDTVIGIYIEIDPLFELKNNLKTFEPKRIKKIVKLQTGLTYTDFLLLSPSHQIAIITQVLDIC